MNATAARIASSCLLLRSRRLSRVITRIYVEAMGHHGLTVAQFTLLAAIGSAPGARAADLAPALDLEKSTLSRELTRLLEEGLVATEDAGGRSLALHITPAGERRLEAALPSWEAAQVEAARALGPLAEGLMAHFSA